MAVREIDVGIQFFTDDLRGFSAVLKHTWRDFHVNEIELDGKVVQLTTLSPSGDGDMVVDESKADSVETVIDAFVALVGKEDGEKLKAFAAEQYSETVESIEIGPVNDKQQRTAIHEFCKKELTGFPPLATESTKNIETGDTFIKIALLSRAKKMKGWRNRKRECVRNKNSAGEPCRYVNFALYKENTDNQTALNTIAKELGVSSTVFRIAGTKDKRGITTQLVAGQNVDISRLASLNSRLTHIKVGNFTPTNQNLFVGDLKGNRFRIALRDIRDASSEEVREACESLKKHGFVNYFGLQRFGKGNPTHEVGIALLKGDWKSAARLILKPTSADDDVIAEAKALYFQGDIDGALKKMPRRAFSERILLEGYVELGEEQHLASINKINRNTRLLYVHAYQGYIWNHVVSERLRRFGTDKVLVGDLVITDDLEDGAVRRKTSGSRIASVKHVTKKDIENCTYDITDVVLPLPGTSIVYPKNEIKQLYEEMASKDEVSLFECSHRVKDFSVTRISGDYRKIVVKPCDFEYDLVSYHHSYEPLLVSDLDGLQKTERSPTLDIDWSKKRKSESEEDTARKRLRTDATDVEDAEKQALKLTFSLPASAYATMLVRQLTKRSTSVVEQLAMSNDDNTNSNQ